MRISLSVVAAELKRDLGLSGVSGDNGENGWEEHRDGRPDPDEKLADMDG